MSLHSNGLFMNDVLIRVEEQSFFADIGEERTLRFVQDSLALSRRHDGNPGEALAGVGQRLGICYYCWDRGTDVRQGICRDCRAADSIGIELDDAEVLPPRDAALSYGFIDSETIRDLLEFLPEQLTRTRRGLVEPHDCHGQDRGLLVIAVAMAAAPQAGPHPTGCSVAAAARASRRRPAASGPGHYMVSS